MANYDEQNKDELVEEARERGLHGYSTLNKDDLVKLLEEDDKASNPEEEEVSESVERAQEVAGEDELPQEVGFASEASDGESFEDELGEEGAALADVALDVHGPLNVQSPSERLMGGALTEEQAQEQLDAIGDIPEDYVGDFREDGSPLAAEEQETVNQEDVIDFPPPLEELESERADLVEARRASTVNADYVQSQVAEEVFPNEGAQIAEPRLFQQRGQLYTDGLSGQADNNLALAYRLHDIHGGMYHVRDESAVQEEVRKLEEDRLGEDDE